MEDRLKQGIAKAQGLEEKLNGQLSDKSVSLSEVADGLKEFRSASEDVALRDLLSARSHDVENRLWVAHSRANATFRKQLSKLRRETPNKPVETRKFIKLYLEFLKDSQRFYRNYIQRLNATYGAIPELEQIAQQASNGPVSPPPSPEVHEATLLSCHQSLIYLGDLSRYRTTERLDREPAWGPAIGYYNLAGTLRPSSGVAFHQQSVVAFEEGSHFRCVYYLYRSIVVNEPHPHAVANLELEFRKVGKAWNSRELLPKSSPQDPSGPRKALLAWFVRLHSQCFQGQPFKGHEELENEVLGHMRIESQNRMVDGTVSKICFINFAAQYTAAMRFQAQPDHDEYMQSYYYYVRINIKTFSMLLETYCTDLEKTTDVEPLDRLTTVARNVLPVLRLSSAWLLTNARLLATGLHDSLREMIDIFWVTYTQSLSFVASLFPVKDLPELSYLFEEDVESISFKPLECDRTRQNWSFENSAIRKPKYSDKSLQRLTPNQEMLARVRNLLLDGLLLAFDEDVPVTFDGSFNYNRVVGPPDETVGPSTVVGQGKEQVTHALSHEQPATSNERNVHAGATSNGNAERQDLQLSRMVDDLVGPEEDSNPNESRKVSGMMEGNVVSHANYPAEAGGLDRRQAAARHNASRSPWQSEVYASYGGWPSPETPAAPLQRLKSVSNLWDQGMPAPRTPPLGSGHARVNSATSVRSRSSVQLEDSLSSFAPTPPFTSEGLGKARVRADRLSSIHIADGAATYDAGMHSPLLFGAGRTPWSTPPRRSVTGETPPNGQGG